ncbi:SDR family NAD(P)-dependent oxidoreductase [Marinimicrobium agarilyticum]|uniref:SDR family NAD(P)-dependent oxidoreductase n=1 Tax=Marinimicrobium agarilyticum TaxID=306546 RepID=UPI0004801CA6|nr:SDR family oxidoreductase [Marinimicrobium agarilyticum]
MNSNIEDNQGRVALITGSTSGIGKAIALRLSDDGFAVVFHSRLSVEKGEKLAKATPNATYIQADLSDQAQAKHLITDVLERHGRLDVLVNNAGINAMIPHGSLQDATPEIWRDLYEVNVIAPWTLIAESENALRASSTKEHPSCVINISSHAGVRPKGASIPYAASKAALNHVTKLLALNLSPDIRVNAIAPGLVDTPMTKNWVEAQRLWGEKSPMKRGAAPSEIAHIASMLVSSTYLTGEIILSDGGLNLT